MKKVTVAIVCYNDRQNIEALLRSLISQTYGLENFEILVVDNVSTDGTREIVQDYARKYTNVRLFINPVRGIAGSRNYALQEAKHELVAFIDSDCEAPAHWLEKLVTGFEKYSHIDDKVVAAGGSNEPPAQVSRFYDALRIFLNTFLGSRGSVQGMRFPQDRQVPHLPTVNVIFNKKPVLATGGFDVTFGNIGEDQDLSYRLLQKGFKYFYIANAGILHKIRATPMKWFKNMFLYGKGRMWLLRKHPGMWHVYFVAPIFLTLGLLSSVLVIWHPAFGLPLLYLPAVVMVSIIECWRMRKISLVGELIRLYLLTHVAYGFGEIYALFRNRPGYVKGMR